MKPRRSVFMLTLELAEKLYSVPVEQREALLLQMAKEHKAKFLGITDKTAPELATEYIKKGIKAKSIIKPLTVSPKSDKL